MAAARTGAVAKIMSAQHASPRRRGFAHQQAYGSQVWLLLGATAAVLAVLAVFGLLAKIEHKPFAFFSKEPAETLDVSRYIGWQAHVTVLITVLGASSALFAALVVRTVGGDRGSFRFLVGIGAFTGLLILDDFLQFHESVYPRFLGVNDHQVYPVYAAALALILWLWGRRVVSDNLGLFLFAGLCLGTSVLADVFLGPRSFPYFHLLEDGAKMLGFTIWTVFLVRAGLQAVMVAVLSPGVPQPGPVQPLSARERSVPTEAS